MTIEDRLTFEESKILAEHATNHSSTKKVALALGIAESRVSEMKSNKRKMTTSEAAILRELYGTPTQLKGIYMEAEIVEGAGNFTNEINQASLSRNISHIFSLINSPSGINTLLSAFRLKNYEVKDFMGFKVRDDEPETLQYLLDGINILIEDPVFLKWGSIVAAMSDEELLSSKFKSSVIYDVDNLDLNKERSILDNQTWADYPNCLEGALNSIGLVFSGRETRTKPTKVEVFRLYLLWLIQSQFESKILPLIESPVEGSFELGKDYSFITQQPDICEIVVTGKEVWSFKLNRLNNTFMTEEFVSMPNDSFDWYSKQNSNDKSSLHSEYYDFAGVSLIQSYELNYYVVVDLVENSQADIYADLEEDLASGKLSYDEVYTGMKRKVFIKIHKTEDVLSSLEQLLTTLGLENVPTNEIKKQLALRGGTIPHARYFN
tara:strand:+ start:8353 stop:9657 length:1305 start_codon:yes stop_codon:yes gene_type:complete